MKRVRFSMVLLLMSLVTLAQDHLSFKGIPIEGSMLAFCQKLKSKGFTSLRIDNNITLFVGDFTGRQAKIGVGATDDGKNVHSVVVLFDSDREWNNLVNTYAYYKDLYTRKYGNASLSVEHNPSQLDGNVSLMYELLQGRVTYASVWEVTGGTIELSIEKADDYSAGMVMIKYRDAQNVEAKIQNDLDDI